MDPVTAMLDGPRAQGAFLLRCVLSPPWSIRIGDESPLSLVVMTRGRAVVCFEGTDPVELHRGDVALVRGPDHYTVADDPTRAPQVFIDADQRCHDLSGAPLEQSMALGVRTWGNARDGETVLLTGSYALDSQVTPRVLDALPRLAVVPAEDWVSPLAQVMQQELGRDGPGQEVVLDRLLDLLLIESLRLWFARAGSEAPRWWEASDDLVVGPALKALQNNPAHPWTVASLASGSGVSRAALARRFTELVGEPPMAFLTEWRLSLAADRLCAGNDTIAAVAREVGYGSPFSLSVAFKRRYGLSPQDYRRAQRRTLTDRQARMPGGG